LIPASAEAGRIFIPVNEVRSLFFKRNVVPFKFRLKPILKLLNFFSLKK
jgi:hypothetical protein